MTFTNSLQAIIQTNWLTQSVFLIMVLAVMFRVGRFLNRLLTHWEDSYYHRQRAANKRKERLQARVTLGEQSGTVTEFDIVAPHIERLERQLGTQREINQALGDRVNQLEARVRNLSMRTNELEDDVADLRDSTGSDAHAGQQLTAEDLADIHRYAQATGHADPGELPHELSQADQILGEIYAAQRMQDRVNAAAGFDPGTKERIMTALDDAGVVELRDALSELQAGGIIKSFSVTDYDPAMDQTQPLQSRVTEIAPAVQKLDALRATIASLDAPVADPDKTDVSVIDVKHWGNQAQE